MSSQTLILAISDGSAESDSDYLATPTDSTYPCANALPIYHSHSLACDAVRSHNSNLSDHDDAFRSHRAADFVQMQSSYTGSTGMGYYAANIPTDGENTVEACSRTNHGTDARDSHRSEACSSHYEVTAAEASLHAHHRHHRMSESASQVRPSISPGATVTGCDVWSSIISSSSSLVMYGQSHPEGRNYDPAQAAHHSSDRMSPHVTDYHYPNPPSACLECCNHQRGDSSLCLDNQLGHRHIDEYIHISEATQKIQTHSDISGMMTIDDGDQRRSPSAVPYDQVYVNTEGVVERESPLGLRSYHGSYGQLYYNTAAQLCNVERVTRAQLDPATYYAYPSRSGPRHVAASSVAFQPQSLLPPDLCIDLSQYADWTMHHELYIPVAPSLPSHPPPVVEDTPKKPLTLACFFCRKRKIACGSPPPGNKDRTCNQCARRNLQCVYPDASRRGMRSRLLYEQDALSTPSVPVIVSQ